MAFFVSDMMPTPPQQFENDTQRCIYETLAQLGPGALPCVHIEDAPAFDYRGMMLDCSRHFWTVDEIKTVLDTNDSGIEVLLYEELR